MFLSRWPPRAHNTIINNDLCPDNYQINNCINYYYNNNIYVTGFGKTLRMGFFQKIEFDAWLISSTIELTRVQVLGRSRASLWRYSALFVIAPHPQ